MSLTFEFRIIGSQIWDFLDDNVDIHIIVNGMSTYFATFFTIPNITSLFEKKIT